MYEKIIIASRILLGILLLVAGANEFLDLFPMPLEGEALAFWTMLDTAGGGYTTTSVALVEIFTGFAFLIRKFVALAAIVLFPILLNALLFHIFLDFGGVALSVVCFFLNVLMLVDNLAAYEKILKP